MPCRDCRNWPTSGPSRYICRSTRLNESEWIELLPTAATVSVRRTLPHEGEDCEFWERLEADPDVDQWDKGASRG
jgi:hypothetical protein